MIPADDLGGLLFSIHTHAAQLLKSKYMFRCNGCGQKKARCLCEPGEKYMNDGAEIVYREKDVIKLLVKLGFPEPVWGKSISIDEYNLPDKPQIQP